jgi:hypothetical protein
MLALGVGYSLHFGLHFLSPPRIDHFARGYNIDGDRLESHLRPIQYEHKVYEHEKSLLLLTLDYSRANSLSNFI